MIYFKRFLLVLLFPVFICIGISTVFIGLALSAIQIPIYFIIKGELPDDDSMIVGIMWNYLGDLVNLTISSLMN